MRGTVFLWLCILAASAHAEGSERGAFDMYELGKRIYALGSDSCLSCHGIDGAGTDRSDVDLRTPSS